VDSPEVDPGARRSPRWAAVPPLARRGSGFPRTAQPLGATTSWASFRRVRCANARLAHFVTAFRGGLAGSWVSGKRRGGRFPLASRSWYWSSWGSWVVHELASEFHFLALGALVVVLLEDVLAGVRPLAHDLLWSILTKLAVDWGPGGCRGVSVRRATSRVAAAGSTRRFSDPGREYRKRTCRAVSSGRRAAGLASE
jgi:hypothetical protein